MMDTRGVNPRRSIYYDSIMVALAEGEWTRVDQECGAMKDFQLAAKPGQFGKL